jgi:hypothetical protein
MAVRRGEGQLEHGEEAPSPRDAGCDKSEFAKELLPVEEANSFTGKDVDKEVPDVFLAVRWQLKGPSLGVYQPTEDGFCSVPGAVAGSELFKGDGLFCFRVRVWALEHLVDGVKEEASHRGAAMRPSLAEGNVVVHKNVNSGEGPVEAHVGGPGRRSWGRDKVSRSGHAPARRGNALRGRHGGASVG